MPFLFHYKFHQKWQFRLESSETKIWKRQWKSFLFNLIWDYELDGNWIMVSGSGSSEKLKTLILQSVGIIFLDYLNLSELGNKWLTLSNCFSRNFHFWSCLLWTVGFTWALASLFQDGMSLVSSTRIEVPLLAYT